MKKHANQIHPPALLKGNRCMHSSTFSVKYNSISPLVGLVNLVYSAATALKTYSCWLSLVDLTRPRCCFLIWFITLHLTKVYLNITELNYLIQNKFRLVGDSLCEWMQIRFLSYKNCTTSHLADCKNSWHKMF